MNPGITDPASDHVRQFRIAQDDPAAGRYASRYIEELVRRELAEIMQDMFLQQLAIAIHLLQFRQPDLIF